MYHLAKELQWFKYSNVYISKCYWFIQFCEDLRVRGTIIGKWWESSDSFMIPTWEKSQTRTLFDLLQERQQRERASWLNDLWEKQVINFDEHWWQWTQNSFAIHCGGQNFIFGWNQKDGGIIVLTTRFLLLSNNLVLQTK